MGKFLSPLRYPGGKAKLYPFICSLLEKNNLLNYSYAEPYAGGAGLALKLLANNLVKDIYLNDFDKAIYAVWHSILNHSEEVIDWIYNIPVDIDNWEKCKFTYINEKENLLELGKATLFLNRTNVSGVIKGGVIGGKLQQGKYKIDARFNKVKIIDNIKFIHKLKDRIHLYNTDGINFLKEIEENVFIYFDPPYYKKGSGLYMNFFKDKDHENLSSVIRSVKNKWIISYDDEEFIRKLYSKYSKITYTLYQSTSNKKGKEIIIFSDDIKFSDSISLLDYKEE